VIFIARAVGRAPRRRPASRGRESAPRASTRVVGSARGSARATARGGARARKRGGNRDDANDEGAFERTFASIQSLIVETFRMTRFTDASVERAAEAMDLEGRASVSFATGERSTTARETTTRRDEGKGGGEARLLSGETFTQNVNPARALTVGLTTTYMSINSNYYDALEARRRLSHEVSPPSSPSREGVRVSETSATEPWVSPTKRPAGNSREVVHDRYLLDKVLGRGSFGKVVLAYDLAEDKHVAIKVIERSQRADAAVAQEIAFLRETGGESVDEKLEMSLEDVHAMNLPGKDACVRLLDVFMHQTEKLGGGYQCLVFEIMSHSLYDLLRVTNLSGVSIKLVRKFAIQIMRALEYTKSLGIIHCDIKPENVLLCHPERSAVKLIDFGSACRCGKQQFSYVQSRFYRAPEVMLGMQYGPAIDMWSAGCMMYELRTGKPLFTGWSEHDQLCRIEATLGRVPRSMFDRIPTEYRARYFDEDGGIEPSPEALRAAQKSDSSVPAPGSRPLAKVLYDELAKRGSVSAQAQAAMDDVDDPMESVEHREKMHAAAGMSREDGRFDEEHEVLLALISRMVTLDASKRITPEQALAHPFFFPLSTKSVAAENHRKSLQEPKAKRLSSIPDMSSVDAMNAREVSGGVGERFTFEHGRK
jgi:dual specificity tyrosine-phosphorylation-regulated kinase 1